MITTEGKNVLRRYFAGEGVLASAISVGLSDTAESLTDASLGFEFARVDVDVIAYDFVNDKLIMKGTLPAEEVGVVHEVGVWSLPPTAQSSGYDSRLITTFDSDTEEWTNSSYVTTNTRIGADSLSHTPATGATSVSDLSELELDLSDNSSADRLVFAYNVTTAPADVVVKFKTDDANYFGFTYSSPSVGYHVDSLTKGSAVVTGAPSWDNITELSVETTATGGGAADVNFDGIRLEDADSALVEYVLVARKVLGTPKVKEAGRVQEFEYALDLTV